MLQTFIYRVCQTFEDLETPCTDRSLMNLRSACCPDRAFAKVQSTFIKTPSHFMFTQRMYFSWLQKMVTQKMWQFMPFIKGILVVVKNCRLKTNLILDVNIKSQRFSWKLSLPIFVSKMHIYKNLPLKKNTNTFKI